MKQEIFHIWSGRWGKSLPLGVVPRAANRNKHDCRWQSYRYYAVMGNAVTEGVYAIDMVKAIVR